MYYRWTFMPAGKERSRSLALIASRGVHDYTDRDLYTFGVYTGESLKFWLERLAALGVTHGPMWGFDSYEGLPAEAEGKKLEGMTKVASRQSQVRDVKLLTAPGIAAKPKGGIGKFSAGVTSHQRRSNQRHINRRSECSEIKLIDHCA